MISNLDKGGDERVGLVIDSKGNVELLKRTSGRFKSALEFSRFPFDVQQLTVQPDDDDPDHVSFPTATILRGPKIGTVAGVTFALEETECGCPHVIKVEAKLAGEIFCQSIQVADEGLRAAKADFAPHIVAEGGLLDFQQSAPRGHAKR